MQPGFDLRIATLLKALSETVLPAVDRGNSAAVEQLHLVVGSLKLLREQIDYAHWFEVVDARSMAALIDRLAAEIDSDASRQAVVTAAEMLAIAHRHDVTLTTVRDANRTLRNAISALAAASHAAADAGAGKRVQSMILAHSEGQISRERAFIAATGFDVFPDTLVSIEESLARAEA